MSETPDNVVPLTPKAVSTMEQFLAEHERELLTILFTDLVDSTRLQSELGNAEAARLVQIHRRLVRDELEKHSSREVEWAGDSCLAVFSMPSDGVRFALTMQEMMRKARRDEANLPHVRVGLHLGEIFVHKQQRGARRTEELFGLQVSEASRVMSLARGDQIYMTRPVYDNARSSMKGGTIDRIGDIQWINHGPYILKGSDEQVEVCEVGEEGHAPLEPPEANEKCRPASSSREVEVITPELLRPGGSGGRSSTARLVAAIVLSSLIGAVAMWLAMRPGPPEPPPPVQRAIVALPESSPLASALPTPQLALSPDGSTLAYVAQSEGQPLLYVRRMDQFEGRPIAGSGGALMPFFSPDSRWVAFYVAGNLKKAPVDGGAVLTISPTGATILGAAWGPDNTIVFSGGLQKPLMQVPASGGEPVPLTTIEDPDSGIGHYWPHFLPGGKDILFTMGAVGQFGDAEIALLSLETGDIRRLVGGGSYARYAAAGHIIYAHANSLLALPFDLRTLEVIGSPSPVVEHVQTDTLIGIAAFDISRNGLLVYSSTGSTGGTTGTELVWIDREGKEEAIGAPSGVYSQLKLSPDGRRLALRTVAPGGMAISVYDLERGTLSRLTFEGVTLSPVWSPDGKRIAYASTRSGQFNLWWRNADGTGDAERLTESPNLQVPRSFSPDGSHLLFIEVSPENGLDIRVLSLDGEGDPEPFLATPFVEEDSQFSPDGRWVAYVSAETGRDEVYVQPYEGSVGKWQISRDGGFEPLWSPDGTELFYLSGTRMMVVDVETSESFSASTPRALFDTDFHEGSGYQHDIAPDGQRFVVIKDDTEARVANHLHFVDNWFTELERLVPTGGK